jgi:valyl-tRNA synthetase
LGEGKTLPSHLLHFARELRKNATTAEHLLWQLLRDRQFMDAKFRRQYTIEPYIVDFYCHEAKLVIELDGGQHGFEERQPAEQKRQTFLESLGLKVLRFWNNEVLENIEGVVHIIAEALTQSNALTQPSPKGRGLKGVLSQRERGRESFIIGTTRPEMLPACVAVFYHPDDTRYQHLKGKFAVTPLFGVRVPILEDDTVEPDKGTGIMMCCTFGDEADIVKWRKHGLETKIILNKYGKLDVCRNPHPNLLPEGEGTPPLPLGEGRGEGIFEQLNGLKTTTAREKIIEMLEASGELTEKKPITHAVKCAERSGAPLEILPTQQWFVHVLEHKEALKEKSALCDWKPEWMAKRMEQWIDGLKWDWCISRQRYYGVPFPLWYFSKKTSPDSFGVPEIPFLPESEHLPVNPLTQRVPKGFTEINTEVPPHGNYRFAKADKDFIVYDFLQDKEIHIAEGEEILFIPDTDVMDTWATSSLTPQISAWGFGCHPERSEGSHLLSGDSSATPQNDTRFHQLFPADLRPQAHEIIRTWAFYTLAKAHLHHDSIPWKNLMISGWCLASDKTKMSKSKGNVVTPASLLETHSADAVRYWASTSRLGADTAFSEDVLKIGRKLVNKLWNASKFVLGMIESGIGNREVSFPDSRFPILDSTLDRWILSRIHHAIAQADACFAEYDYAGARAAVEDVFWNDFCDNYLELVKVRAYGNMGEAGQASAIATLSASLNALLKLFAPFVPHITEELYHLVYPQEAAAKHSIHARGNWPNAAAYLHDKAAEQGGVEAVALLELVRKAKSERGVSIKYPITEAWVSDLSPALYDAIAEDVKAAGTITTLHLVARDVPLPADAVTIASEQGEVMLSVRFAAEANVA